MPSGSVAQQRLMHNGWSLAIFSSLYAEQIPYLCSPRVLIPITIITFKAELSSILQEMHKESSASGQRVAVEVIVLTMCLLSVTAVWARGRMDCTTHPMVELVRSALVSVANLKLIYEFNLSISLSETLNSRYSPLTEVITTSLASQTDTGNFFSINHSLSRAMLLLYSMYYKPMMYYKPTPSSVLSSCIGIRVNVL